jgi:hypothetical protein
MQLIRGSELEDVECDSGTTSAYQNPGFGAASLAEYSKNTPIENSEFPLQRRQIIYICVDKYILTTDFSFRICIDDIQPGDRFNTYVRMNGMIKMDFGEIAVEVKRDDTQLWWVMTEWRRVRPYQIVSAWRSVNQVANDDTGTPEKGFGRLQKPGFTRGAGASPSAEVLLAGFHIQALRSLR